jgi:hypothetical protein
MRAREEARARAGASVLNEWPLGLRLKIQTEKPGRPSVILCTFPILYLFTVSCDLDKD